MQKAEMASSKRNLNNDIILANHNKLKKKKVYSKGPAKKLCINRFKINPAFIKLMKTR